MGTCDMRAALEAFMKTATKQWSQQFKGQRASFVSGSFVRTSLCRALVDAVKSNPTRFPPAPCRVLIDAIKK